MTVTVQTKMVELLVRINDYRKQHDARAVMADKRAEHLDSDDGRDDYGNERDGRLVAAAEERKHANDERAHAQLLDVQWSEVEEFARSL